MNTLQRTYDLIRSGIVAQFGTACPIEPFTHVAAVEELRHVYRPPGEVRFLLVAESHVRTDEATFVGSGMQFIYEHRYYTPWWHDLILPAFGSVGEATTAESRQAYLLRLREAGFWLLDASIVALSGYKNVGAAASRPFEGRRDRILTLSWSGHVRALFQEVMAQSVPPIIVTFDNVASVLPPTLRDRVPRLKFKGQSNSKQYRTSAYHGGTTTFVEAVRRAGLHECLRGAVC